MAGADQGFILGLKDQPCIQCRGAVGAYGLPVVAPSNTSPESRSPSNDLPGTTPTRRYPPGVAPTICSLRTPTRITNNEQVLSVLRASGSLSIRLGDMMAYLQRLRF